MLQVMSVFVWRTFMSKALAVYFWNVSCFHDTR